MHIKLALILFYLVMTIPEGHSFAHWFWLSDNRESFYETRSEYNFEACQVYANDEITQAPISCGLANLPGGLENTRSFQDWQEISRHTVEEAITQDLRDYVFENLEEKIRQQQQLRDCFHPGPARSEWCQNKTQVLREDLLEFYPRMRLHMAMKTPQISSALGVVATFDPVFQAPSEISHARETTRPEPISPEEIPQIEAQFHEETNSYEQEWFLLQRDNRGDCVEQTSSGLYQFSDEYCRRIHWSERNQYIHAARNGRTRDHDEIYRHLLAQSPHFAFIQNAQLPTEESAQNALLAQSFDQLIGQSIEQLNRLKTRGPNDFKFLFRYPHLVESFIEERGHNRLMCDALQHLHDFDGEGGWNDLVGDIGLALAALGGGVACVLTSGFACAAAVAIGTETIFISRDQANLDDGVMLYRAGLIDSHRVDALEGYRNFSLALAPLAFVGLEVGRGVSRSFPVRHLARQTLRDTESWLHYMPTNPAQNRAWIQSARNQQAHLYFDVENAALKRLNDTLGDKNLVTSLTNGHKQLLFEEMDELLRRFPGVEVERYSDFKSSRFAFHFPGGQEPEGFSAALNELYLRVGERFESEVKKISGLNLGSENPSQWFAAGLGGSADQAGLAARQARAQNGMLSFSDIAPTLQRQRQSVEEIRQSMAQQFSTPPHSSLLVRNEHGAQIPSVEVFEVLRKVKGKSQEEIAQAFRAKFQVDLSAEQSHLLLNYIDEVDQFSPGLWVEQRVLANLDEAEFGGFSADFKGMGARNIYQVASDLTVMGDDLPQAIARMRDGEGAVTTGFNQAKSSYENLISEQLERMGVQVTNRCSGDDCVSLPAQSLTRQQEQEVVQSIARSGQPDAYRLSFIPPGIRTQDRTVLAVHGELVEKELRASLTGFDLGQISPSVMSEITFAMRMPAQIGRGQIDLMLATSQEVSLTAAQRAQIEDALQTSIQNINRRLSQELGQSFDYR